MRAGRLLSILILLQLRARLTAQELADEFHVSVRTIYRDIEELCASGIPIYADRGPGGGFQLVDGYRTRLTGLATDEAEAVFMIGLPGAAAALGLGSAANSAGRKLLASLPPPLSEGAGRMLTRFHLDPLAWYHAPESVGHLPTIARAVLDQKVITMSYESWTGTRPWRVEPLGLVLKAGSWYLVAQGAGKVRIFKVSNVLEQATLDETFDRPSGFDLPSYWSDELKRFESELRLERATLRASALGRKRIARIGDFAARAVAEAEPPDADGWAQLVLPFENIEQAALMLIGVGPEVEVLEPSALTGRVRDLALQIVNRADRRP